MRLETVEAAMSDCRVDVQAIPNKPRRITAEGRKFGDVPYTAPARRPSEEILRKSIAAMADEVAEQWDRISGRTTGSRRRSL